MAVEDDREGDEFPSDEEDKEPTDADLDRKLLKNVKNLINKQFYEY